MGGDYGFGWNPHGDYARELVFFVKDVGLTPHEVITCATKTGAEIMGPDHEFGTLEPGKLADPPHPTDSATLASHPHRPSRRSSIRNLSL